MGYRRDLEKYTLDDLLDEIALRCDCNADKIDIVDLVTELSSRKEIHTTVVDPGETLRHIVRGPAVVLTYFD